LAEIPLKFATFVQLKVLYLHDNQILNIDINKTQVEYVSLFDNPIKDYRAALIESNDKLIGIDHNIVANNERIHRYTVLPKYSVIKWPIVELSSNL
jgi:hypothetical protein